MSDRHRDTVGVRLSSSPAPFAGDAVSVSSTARSRESEAAASSAPLQSPERAWDYRSREKMTENYDEEEDGDEAPMPSIVKSSQATPSRSRAPGFLWRGSRPLDSSSTPRDALSDWSSRSADAVASDPFQPQQTLQSLAEVDSTPSTMTSLAGRFGVSYPVHDGGEEKKRDADAVKAENIFVAVRLRPPAATSAATHHHHRQRQRQRSATTASAAIRGHLSLAQGGGYIRVDRTTGVVECRHASMPHLSNTSDSHGQQQQQQPPLRFNFDHLFDAHATQQQVMEEIGQRAVERVLAGYHGTVLCYGQSGSGKTHSLIGPRGGCFSSSPAASAPSSSRRRRNHLAAGGGEKADEALPEQNNHADDDGEAGLLPRMLLSLFDELQGQESGAEDAAVSSSTFSWSVSMSVLELYGETLHDLVPTPIPLSLLSGGRRVKRTKSSSSRSSSSSSSSNHRNGSSNICHEVDCSVEMVSIIGGEALGSDDDEDEEVSQPDGRRPSRSPDPREVAVRGEEEEETVGTVVVPQPRRRRQSRRSATHPTSATASIAGSRANGSTASRRSILVKEEQQLQPPPLQMALRICESVAASSPPSSTVPSALNSSRYHGNLPCEMPRDCKQEYSCHGEGGRGGTGGGALPSCITTPWNPPSSGGVFVDGLRRHTIRSHAEAMLVARQALRHRQVGATELNERSSRSHVFFLVDVEQRRLRRHPHQRCRTLDGNGVPSAGRVKDQEDSNRSGFVDSSDDDDDDGAGSLADVEVRNSMLTLVDLAGSERVSHTGAKGQRLREAQSINLSLTLLSNVIRQLSAASTSSTSSAPSLPKRRPGGAQGSALPTGDGGNESSPSAGHFISFRDSKLTRLLKSSLGGNAITFLLCTISPDRRDYTESVSTLRFAKLSKQIKNNATVNAVKLSDVDAKVALAAAETQAKQLQHQLVAMQRTMETMKSYTSWLEEHLDAISVVRGGATALAFAKADASPLELGMQANGESPREGWMQYFMRRQRQLLFSTSLPGTAPSQLRPLSPVAAVAYSFDGVAEEPWSSTTDTPDSAATRVAPPLTALDSDGRRAAPRQPCSISGVPHRAASSPPPPSGGDGGDSRDHHGDVRVADLVEERDVRRTTEDEVGQPQQQQQQVCVYRPPGDVMLQRGSGSNCPTCGVAAGPAMEAIKKSIEVFVAQRLHRYHHLPPVAVPGNASSMMQLQNLHDQHASLVSLSLPSHTSSSTSHATEPSVVAQLPCFGSERDVFYPLAQQPYPAEVASAVVATRTNRAISLTAWEEEAAVAAAVNAELQRRLGVEQQICRSDGAGVPAPPSSSPRLGSPLQWIRNLRTIFFVVQALRSTGAFIDAPDLHERSASEAAKGKE